MNSPFGGLAVYRFNIRTFGPKDRAYVDFGL
jgi:hypothetical protein